ncbi:MAG: putative peptidoglycan-binding domain-containing protein [Alphaproteobacteria bacterium]
MASGFSIPDWLVDRAATDAPADPPDQAAAEREAVRRYGRVLSASAAASRALAGLDGDFASDTDFATAPERYRAVLDAVGREHEGAFEGDDVGRSIFRRDFGALADHAVQRFQSANAGREAEHWARTLEDRWDSLAALASGADEEGRAAILRQAALEAHRAQGFGLVPDADAAFRGFLARIEPTPEAAEGATGEIQVSGRIPTKPATRQKPAPSPAESPLSDTERGRMLDRLSPHEGGVANHPEDKLTHYGVTDEALKDYKSRAEPGNPIMKKEVKDLSNTDARIVLDEMIRQYRVDRIEDLALRQHIFDMIVNHSPSLAIRTWQRTLNQSGLLRGGAMVEEDGVLGPATRAAINGLSAEQRRMINDAIVNERIALYRNIVREHPEKKKFEPGWFNRANSFRLPRPDS